MKKQLRQVGWIPDKPDKRDYHLEVSQIDSLLAASGIEVGAVIPSSVDLRQWCSPIENQGNLNSCSAHAGVGLLEYFERKAAEVHIDASRLFLYKTSRKLDNVTKDVGAPLRTTMKAMAMFGIPPEKYWPYDEAKVNVEPDAFCYSLASNFKAKKYFRLDPIHKDKETILKSVKTLLAGGFPCMFGFHVYLSYLKNSVIKSGAIPYPAKNEPVLQAGAGHAVIAVGYDDDISISHPEDNSATTGAFLIRNSQGHDWGFKGYGWLPYQFLLEGKAKDWWTLLKSSWIDTGKFGF